VAGINIPFIRRKEEGIQGVWVWSDVTRRGAHGGQDVDNGERGMQFATKGV
jgi:hypothetical protein